MKPELAKIGPEWEGGNIERWPGVAGIAGVTNHYGLKSSFFPDPVNSSSVRDIVINGGKKKTAKKFKKCKRCKKSKKSKKTRSGVKSRKKTKRKMRGGSKHGNTLLPQSLVNLGRTAQYNVQGFLSDFTGSKAPVNPDPSVQPLGK